MIKYENKIIYILLQQLCKQHLSNKIIFNMKQNINRTNLLINLKKKFKVANNKILKKISFNCKCV